MSRPLDQPGLNDLMQQLTGPQPDNLEPGPRPTAGQSLKQTIKPFMSDLMYVLSSSIAASQSAPGSRGTAMGLAAALAGPAQRRTLIQQAEDEKRQLLMENQRKESELQSQIKLRDAQIDDMYRKQIEGMMTPDIKEYYVWREQQPKGTDDSFEAFKATMSNATSKPEYEVVEEERTLSTGEKYMAKVVRPKVNGLVVGPVKSGEDPAVLKVLDKIYGADAVKRMSPEAMKAAVKETAELLQPFGLDFGQRQALQPPRVDPNDKPATADQEKALTFHNRMVESNRDIDKLDSWLNGLSPSGLLALNNAPNSIQSKEGQLFHQGAEKFVRAVLRRESGAVIGKQEFEDTYRTYFPVTGDKPENIAKKKESRLQAIADMQREAGRAYTLSNQGPSNGGSVADPLGIR